MRFKHWGIFQKVMSISVILNVVMVITSLFYLIPLVEKKLMEEKQNALQDVLAIAYTLIEAYSHKVDNKEMTVSEAQKNALVVISELRYRDNDYFWVNDLEPRMLMHPNFPNLVGTNLVDDTDPTGKHLFVEMVHIVKEKGEGFVYYMWPKPDGKEPVAKLSYVKLFKPWGWVIGSGIYVDDVQVELTRLKWNIIVATLISVFIVLIFAYFVAHKISELWKWLSYNPPE